MKSLTFFSAIILFVSPLLTHAAFVSIGTTKSVPVGGIELVQIVLDTQGEYINALEGDVVIPQKFLSTEYVQDSGSVVSFWTETPSITQDVVHFSGIIPGGFRGQGVIAEIAVSGITEGVASVSIPTFTVFLHDGEGIPQEAHVQGGSVRIISSDAKPTTPSALDTTPPETFSIVLVENEPSFEGKRVLIFATHDEGSGMGTYEVQETDNDTPSDLLWVPAKSPFILSDTPTHYIFVRATDNAGNSTVVRYDGDTRTPLERALYTLVFLTLVLLLTVVFIRHKHHQHVRRAWQKTSEGN